MATPNSAAGAPSADAAKEIPNLRTLIPKLEPRSRRQPTANRTPVPDTPPLPSPPDVSNWTFSTPTRRILSPKDHEIFLKSPTRDLIVAWVFGLAESVVGTPDSDYSDADFSDQIRALVAILDEAEELAKQSPPNEQGGSRFGNKAFRGFLDLVKEKLPAWHNSLGITNPDAINELSAYLNQSFGNRNRIDYGSGHELNFAIWMLCMYQMGAVQKTDFPGLVLRVFVRYLRLMRTVQMMYYLEPAGSHGVWGLDDYQFLPFLFGASQLRDHSYITPRAIHHALTLEEFGEDYMYLGQVNFVNSTKTVKGLRWHSPMLDDISSAKSWTKINEGMRRMFVAEVLGKLPVMQHFLFGSLVPAEESMSQEDEVSMADEDGEHEGHDHGVKGWGDCCGIKVPSSIAAAQELRKMGKAEPLRRIPFD